MRLSTAIVVAFAAIMEAVIVTAFGVALFSVPVHAATVYPRLATTGAKTGGLSPQNGSYTGITPGTALVVTASRTVTFGVAPSVGDCLVAYGSGTASFATLTAGWTLVPGSQFNSGAAGLAREMAFHKVGVSEGSTFTPFSDAPVAETTTAVFDVGSSTVSNCTSSDFTVADGVANSTGPSSTTIAPAADNTLVLAFSWEFASGATYSAPTVTGPTTGLVNATTHQISASYGTARYAGTGFALGVTGNWTGGAGSSNTGGFMLGVK